MALTNPANLPYQVSVLVHRYKPGFVMRKVLMTAWSALRPSAQERGVRCAVDIDARAGPP